MNKNLTTFFLFFVLFNIYGQEKLIERIENSQLKIPFTHFLYNDLFTNAPDSMHTGLKPLHFFEISHNLYSSYYSNLLLPKKTKAGKKLFNEHLFVIEDDDYFVTIDPIIDWRLGKDNLVSGKTIFQNTRGIRVEGQIGKQVSFSSSIVENWARFPKYMDRYAWYYHPPIVPGFGLNKSEDHDHVDYPYVEGYLAYKPSKYFFFELGHGKHFIGEGYRSLLLSDNATVYPYFKIEATFWKVKYTTMWTAYQNISFDNQQNGVFKKKYSAIHYIDWHALPKLHLGFFETVVWYNENRRGFDVNFLNPLIFFKTAEYEAGSNGSNTILGLNFKYNAPLDLHLYGQLVLDEMTVDKFFGEKGYWANKFGYQIGIKTLQTKGNNRIFARLEYNTVRPYTYSHALEMVNYTHDYESLAHPFGANFKETLFELQYRYKRIYAQSILTYAKKGFDFDDTYHYGGDLNNYIYPTDKSNEHYTLQGNLGKLFQNKIEAGYILNPAIQLKIFGGAIYRKTEIDQETSLIKNETSKYIYFGIKTHLWNERTDVF